MGKLARIGPSFTVGIGLFLLPAAPAWGIGDFAGYSPATNDLFSTWGSLGDPVVRNTASGFVGQGLDFSGIGYGFISEVYSRAYLSPVHVASAGHTTTFQSNFYVAPITGGPVIKLSGGNTRDLGAVGYDSVIGDMTAAHIAPNSGVTTYAILDLPNLQDYDERTVFEVGHGNSDPGLSPRIAVTTIASVGSTTFTTRRPEAPLQGGDSGGPTMTAWTNPLGVDELTFLGTHYGTDFSGNTVNSSNFFANTTTINAANNTLRKDSGGVDIPNSAMIHQGFAVRLVGVAATTWTGGTSSNFGTAGNWSNGGPVSTNYVAFNGESTAQRAVSFGAAAQALRGIQFGPGAAGEGFTFSNGTLQIGRGGIANYSSAVQTFDGSLGITLTDHQYWDAINADLHVAGSVNLNGKLLVVQGSQNTRLSGVLGDSTATSIGLTKYGTGDLVLTQAATYAGKTWIYGGTVRFEGSGALPTSTPLVIANNDTVRLELDGRHLTVPSLTSVLGPAGQQGTIDLGSGGRVTLDQAVNVDAAFSGAITGGSNAATSLVLRGPTGSNIEFNLSGPSTFAGQTRIERGTVYLGHTNALGANGAGNETLVIADDANAPVLRLTAQGTLNETIVLLNSSTATSGTASGSMTFSSPTATLAAPIILARAASSATRGTSWTLQSVNSSGSVTDTHFSDITPRLEAGAAVGNSASSLTFSLHVGSQFTLDGVISNGTLGTALNVTHTGLGTVWVNAANSYTGSTSLRGNRAVALVDALSGQDGAFGNATSTITIGAQAVSYVMGLYAGHDVEIGRNLSVSATNLTGVQIGALDHSTALYSGTIALNRAETSLYAGADSTVTFSNNITTGSGTPKIVKQGDGLVILAGINSHTGGTTVEAGRLRAQSTQALGTTGTVSVGGGVLEIAAGVTLANPNLQLAGGRLEVNGVAGGLDFQAGTLSGSGVVNASVALDSAGKVLSPGQGNAPGAITVNGDQTWTAFTYDWQANNLATAANPSTTADSVIIDGTLILGGSYQLRILSLTQANEPGDAPDYDGGDRVWTVLTATDGITGFNAAQWALDSSAFQIAGGGTGSFTLYQDDNTLKLAMTVPEPGTLALAGVAMGYTLLRRSRRKPPAGRTAAAAG